MDHATYKARILSRDRNAIGEFYPRTVTFTIAFGDRWSGDLTMAAIEQNAREGFETLYVWDVVLQPVPIDLTGPANRSMVTS